MIEFFKRLFDPKYDTENDGGSGHSEHDLQVAVCALFLEIANSDREFDKNEWDNIIANLKRQFGISDEVAIQLTEEAAKAVGESIDIWKFTNRINETYSVEEKIRVVEMLWRIVYADGKVDMNEDYLVRKSANLLNLKDSQLIEAKLAAKGK